MLESLINPKRAEREPWQMAIIGFIYASLSVLISKLLFSNDPVLSQYLGIFVITFCVIFSMPFVYYTLKLEEDKDMVYEGEGSLIKEHSRAILAFLFLFLGFVIAFSLMYMILPNGENYFKAQIETYCHINSPGDVVECAKEYGIKNSMVITGAASAKAKFLSILSNNIYVLIFTLLFSLVLGAGAIFILAWNASVIAAAIGIFTKSEIAHLPLGLLRYLIHGLPEIAAYFVAALAGGILSMAVIRHHNRSEKFWSVAEDSLVLVIIAVVILVVSALIEVFITPRLF